MRIAFDATALPSQSGGAGNYIARLLRGLKQLNTGDRFFVLAKRDDVDRLGPWPSGAGFEPVPVGLRTRPQRLAWEQTAMPSLLRRIGIDLLHSPHYTVPLVFTSAARVVTFHDLIFFLFPEYHSVAKLLYFRRMIRWASRAADHIITDSHSTRSDAIRLLGLAPESLTTVHLAASDLFRPIADGAVLERACARYQIPSPFILSVCTLEPRKNLVGAIRALRLLRNDSIETSLAIVGAKGWQVDRVFREASDPQVRDHVVFSGYVPDEDLPALYSACDVFLYPTLYEGFGLPALEAMACGAAVVASDRSSLPEVVGEAGLLCNPDDPADIAAKLRELLTDAAARHRYGACARTRAAEFSWEKTARATYDVYTRVNALRRARSTASTGEIAS